MRTMKEHSTFRPNRTPYQKHRRVILWFGSVLFTLILLRAMGVSLPDKQVYANTRSAVHHIYDDTLHNGWADWSWDSTTLPTATQPVHSGTHSYAITYQAAWASLYLKGNGVATAGFTHLRFWLHGGPNGGQQIQVKFNNDEAYSYPVTAPAATWMRVDIPLSGMGTPTTLVDLFWQDAGGGAQSTFYLDDIALVDTSDLPATPTPPAPVDVDLFINLADRHPISEGIYGIHYAADDAFAAEIDLPVRRWGGNNTTRYNWQTNMFGNPDWYFENELATTTADDFVAHNREAGVASILTIPMSGWVAKAPGTVGDSSTYPCSFDTRKYRYTPQPLPGGGSAADPDDPNRAHCGSGIVRYEGEKPIYFTGNDPHDTSIPVDESWTTAWIAHLQQQFGTAAAGGVRYYSLDNEPDIWWETHRDVRPTALTMQALRDATMRYAAAIKAVDPAAQTLGPVLFGWTYYWHSPADGQQAAWENRPDRKANGDVPLVPWYLRQLAAYEAEHGVRLLDYLDLHYYVAADGASQQGAGDATTQARRLRSTRSLWDPTYVDESWIAQAPVSDEKGPVRDYNVVRLIPRMREWVAANYPGTKLAITEYNWGALDHINGALAQADVLGIFGREGLDMALLFDSPYSAGGHFTADGPGAYAFRIYRNYDGQGSKFGETSLRAASSDQDRLAVYAAERSNDGALTVVIINKTADPLRARLTLLTTANSTVGDGSAQRYRYSEANRNAIVQEADLPLNHGTLVDTYPGNSITLVVLPQGSVEPIVLDEKVYLPLVAR